MGVFTIYVDGGREGGASHKWISCSQVGREVGGRDVGGGKGQICVHRMWSHF